MEITLSAVLLAGGKSTRMGRDKCLLSRWTALSFGGGKLDVLGALSNDVMVAAPTRPEWLPAAVRWVADAAPNVGPLAGLVAGLAAARHEDVVVLAVDLPAMTAEYLRGLGTRAVPERLGWFEPLAAIYPRAALDNARQRLALADHSLQAFVRQLRETELVRAVPVRPEDEPLFRNLNAPSDLG